MSGRPPGSRPDRATCQSKASSASAAHHSREIRQPLRNASRTSAANSRTPPASPARYRRRCLLPAAKAAGNVTSGRAATVIHTPVSRHSEKTLNRSRTKEVLGTVPDFVATGVQPFRPEVAMPSMR